MSDSESPVRQDPVAAKRVMLTFGPLTEARVRAVLEEQLAALWAAALESHGYDWREGWQLRWEELRLERVGRPDGVRATP